MFSSEALLGLPGYEITGVREGSGLVFVSCRYVGERLCPHCGGKDLRLRSRRLRRVRHESYGERRCALELESCKWRCSICQRSFWQRFPGILPRKRATEPFRKMVAHRHQDGIDRRRLSLREGIGSATVERWFRDCLERKSREFEGTCPRVLGIDEHFFTRKDGYATTFCDLTHRRVFDVTLGRSEASLEGYLRKLKGKEKVEVICMDLSCTYRAIARKHFPQARVVADRFHVVRLVNHHFLSLWRQVDPKGSRHRGLLSLMRRHSKNLKPQQAESLARYLQENPAWQRIYDVKQELCELLLYKACNQQKCREIARRFLAILEKLLGSQLDALVSLGQTLSLWQEEIAAMWRFTKNNGITEGFHNKMEALSRRAYGFRNFENYRLRVRVMCG